MVKKMDKLKELFIVNKKSIIFMLVIFIIAITSGSIFSIILSQNDKIYVNNYLKGFLENTVNNKINITQIFNNLVLSNILYLIIMWIIGISIIGFPIVIILFFLKSFAVGFTIGSILSCYKFNGIIISLLYLFPHNIICIIVYFLISIYSITLSKKMFYAFVKRKTVDFKNIVGRYTLVLTVSIILMLICVLYESFALPNIFKTFNFLIN